MKKKVVILCIGSDKISGDSLGPLVGSSLKDDYNMPCPIYGIVGRTVNGINLDDYAQMLKTYHEDILVIAVDAAVGKKEEVGKIHLKRGGIRAGGALDSKKDYIGDIGIVGVVAEETTPESVYSTLLEVPFMAVMEMSKRISAMIAQVILG